MSIDEKLQKHLTSFEMYLKKAKREFEARIKEELKENASLEDFKLMKTLGTGSFGRVVLCQYKDSVKKLLAMKIMEKVNIIRTKQLVHTISEIRFLDALKFPFVIQMEYFFKNNVYLFLVMPFINGGEMFYHLRSNKKFDENLCKFYTAQVILSFEYIHYLGIVYRDLKPENILIDDEGYLKITDLGFCKKIDNQRTYTLCGTPEYLAPEIILSQGYTFTVDWWSLGILIYEMAAGFPPFFARDHMKLYEKIVAGKFACPPHFSKPLKDLMVNILQVDRSKRYGGLKGGSKDIKSHEWLKGTDFDQIFSRKVKPSFVPVLDNQGDTKFFDSYGETHIREASFNEYEEEFKDMSLK
ncbi:cAMP-dependent protein kinase catalytic subunit beta [Leptinotarsa decemlineata]|uniref:cAMP-dependent protein kinase catalytic subunit beta n=1 Tax=Leptinotarsa decemlineata TaxID=7539 RepID=UPI000C251BAA|nr:cAMP-dependent protein kinase catalytic subunit beta-like [Leptinotarsa decemlineata]